MTNRAERKEGMGSYVAVDLETLTRAWASPVNRENVKTAFSRARPGSEARQYLDHLLELVKLTADLLNTSAQAVQSIEEAKRLLPDKLVGGARTLLDEITADALDPKIKVFELRSNRNFIGILKRFDFSGKLRLAESFAILIGDRRNPSPRAYLMSSIEGNPSNLTMAKVDLSPILSMYF